MVRVPVQSAAAPAWRRAASIWRAGQCEVCRAWTAGAFCAPCLERFAAARPRCRRCAIDVPEGTAVCGACLHDPLPLSRADAAVGYAYPWDRVIHRFKHGDVGLAEALSELLDGAVPMPDVGAEPWVLPVPLTRERLRERGYNQAWELARRLARRRGWPASAHLLLRVLETPHQVASTRAQRQANVRGAFAMAPDARRALSGQAVLLVDDVMTTGATVAEAATTLLRAGVRRVDVAVVARTPLD